MGIAHRRLPPRPSMSHVSAKPRGQKPGEFHAGIASQVPSVSPAGNMPYAIGWRGFSWTIPVHLSEGI